MIDLLFFEESLPYTHLQWNKAMNKTVEKAVKTMRELPDKEATLAAQVMLSVVEHSHGLERMETLAEKARQLVKKSGLSEADLDAIVRHG